MENENYLTVKIKTTGIEKTPALEQYVREKLEMLEKHFAHYIGETNELIAEVEIGKTTEHHKQGNVFRAEINFTAGGNLIRAEDTNEDLYAAIDGAKDDLERELRKHKTKHSDGIRRGAAKIKEMVRGGDGKNIT